jgi:DNA excision repair protein ERCC-4
MDFRIVIDTREQEPYHFDCATERRKLEAGDYSVAQLEDAVAVERKSLKDFVSTVIHDSGRFAAELQRLLHLEAACVVVEADLDHVLRGLASADCRGASPESVLGIAAHISLRYGVPVFWCGSRQAARAFTEAYLRMFVRLRAQGGGQP